MENDTRKIVRDFFNDMYERQEMLNIFDLMTCPVCSNYNLEEDMVYHKWDIGCIEEKICPSCRNNE